MSRAIKVAVDSGAKIINMSFGEPASRSSGFLRRIIDDAVLQHGVTFLASAGNAGPALQVSVLVACFVISFHLKPMFSLSLPQRFVTWSLTFPFSSTPSRLPAHQAVKRPFLHYLYVTFGQEHSAASSVSPRMCAKQPPIFKIFNAIFQF